MATATIHTPAQYRKAYEDIQSRTGVNSDILAELTKAFDDTDGFTNEAKIGVFAENFNDLLEMAGYDFSAPDAPSPPPAAPKAKPTTLPAAKGEKDKKGGKGKKVEKVEENKKPSGGQKTDWAALAKESFKKGDRVQVKPAASLPGPMDGVAASEEHEPHLEQFAGKVGTVTYVGNKAVWSGPLKGGGYKKRYLASVTFDDGTDFDGMIPLVALSPAKGGVAKKPAPKLLEGMDDEACRLLVKDNDRRARAARREADFAEYKSAQLKAGKSAAEVDALTVADMKKKRTLSDVAKGASESLVHNITKHLGSKSATLKNLPERYQKLLEGLEAQAAEHVAEFAKNEARWVNESLLKAIKDAGDEVPDAK